MAQNLQLPNPSPKGCEQEKWKAMVDSVIEFISASRTMLYVLNERLKDSERAKEEEKKRVEDEKTKLTFYKECLHLEIQPKFNIKSADSKIFPVEEKSQIVQNSSLEDSGISSKGQGDKIYVPKQHHPEERLAKSEIECQKNADKPLTEIQGSQTLETSQASHCIQTNPGEEIKSPTGSPCPRHPDIKCKKIIAQENLHKQLGQAGLPSQCANGLPRCSMTSKIPRTKSMVEEKTRSAMIEKAPTEGSPAKRTGKETTYSNMRQRSKTPKGDSPAVL